MGEGMKMDIEQETGNQLLIINRLLVQEMDAIIVFEMMS